MALRSLRVTEQPQLMIIPMIDVIFFLLVFFMMSTLYMVAEHTIPVALPQAAAAHQDKPPITAITVLQGGDVVFGRDPVPLSRLAQQAAAVLAEQPDSVFVLRADKQTEYEKVVSVIDELKTAGVSRLSIAAERKAR